MSGSVTTIPLLPSSPYFDSSSHPVKTITLGGPPGPNKERQESPHAHEVSPVLLPLELLIPDLGGDRVYRLRRDSNGDWKTYSHISYPAGHGPRHVSSYDGVIYALQELIPSVAASPIPTSAEPTIVDTVVSTLSGPLPEGVIAAEILIPTPNEKFPTPYIYTTNRNIPSESGDTISVLSISPTLTLLAEIPTGLKHLRGIKFGGPEDRWLIAGGAQGGGVKVFERVDGGKGLKEVARLELEKELKPTGFLWL